MGTVTNFGDSILVSFTAALSALLGFIPALIGAIVVLVIGWVLSNILARLVRTVLMKVGFEKAASRTGVTSLVARGGTADRGASWVMGELVKWFIRLIFLGAAAQILHMSAVSNLLNSIVLWIPNLIVALVTLLLGMLLADVLGPVVRGAASRGGLGNPDLLATLAEFGVMAFAVIVALNQLGIAKELVDALFIGMVFAMALAIGLAFGLGGRETAGEIWQRMYRRSMGPSIEGGAGPGVSQVVGETPRPALQPSTTVKPIDAEA